MDYEQFLYKKTHYGAMDGFAPLFLPESLFDFQRALVEWAISKGRAAIFADCGLGKSLMQLVWSENVVRHTNKPVLILTPLAVSHQTVAEAAKFGIQARRSADGATHGAEIVVTNYEKLHYFNCYDFAGVVCDESGILKSFDGATKHAITEFMKSIPYRLLCTATPAPNDFHELGTSSEALGYLGYMDMLNRFFKNEQNNSATGRVYGEVVKWRLKGHAELPFWQWVCSWARAIRQPSDLGFSDARFVLPPLTETEHLVKSATVPEGMLFPIQARGLQEQREERRRTLPQRCEKVAELANTDTPTLIWCHLNPEGDTLEKIIPDAVQISGKDCDEAKEEKFEAFTSGNTRVLISKPKIGAWGLNFQHCAHVVSFPSHSYEQHYQGIRRCYRFGQNNPVHVDIVTTEGESGVLKNLQRKARQAEGMFINLIAEMNRSLTLSTQTFTTREEIPSWLY